MAYPFLYAIAMGVQSAQGTPNAAIVGLTGPATVSNADGLISGNPEAGEGESGISLQLSKNLVEKGVIPGSFTKPFAINQGVNVETFSLSHTMKGNGAVAPSVAADYTPDPGIDAAHRASGLTGASWGSGTGWEYITAPATYCTAGIWVGRTGTPESQYVVLQDVLASDLTILQDPNGISTLR